MAAPRGGHCHYVQVPLTARPRESGDPERLWGAHWVPACAGTSGWGKSACEGRSSVGILRWHAGPLFDTMLPGNDDEGGCEAPGMHPVLRTVLQRLGLGLLTLFIVSTIIFSSIELLPGDFAAAILGQSATPETVAAF